MKYGFLLSSQQKKIVKPDDSKLGGSKAVDSKTKKNLNQKYNLNPVKERISINSTKSKVST